MGTFTAQILVGSPHPHHGGIEPTHYLFLSENSQPAWVLVNENLLGGASRDVGRIVWIPTPDDMLEDAILMIAIHVARAREIIERAKSFNGDIMAEWVELFFALKEAHRRDLYQRCRLLSDFPKLIISTFRGSTIADQLPKLNEYEMDIEVCPVRYSRLTSEWMGGTRREGSL